VARVSVIIPAYNAEPFLAETLGSVETQTYRDWEVVVADDGSTDGTVEIAAGFGERFTVLTGAANEGPASARNRALEAASGELVVLLDADDIWTPPYLERIVQLYDETKSRGVRVGIVSSDALILGPDGIVPQTYLQLMGFPERITVAKMLVSNQIFGGALAPRALVDEVGQFCGEIFGTEDYDLWLRIVERGYEVVVTREALTTYRLHAASVSTNLPRMARSLQLTYRRALDRGRLTPREQRVARRQLRFQQALEQLGLLLEERRHGERPYRRLLRELPLFVRVAAENPDRLFRAPRFLAGHGSPMSQIVR
jgi:glycosyltransferase involved in cell wall biosynthesis